MSHSTSFTPVIVRAEDAEALSSIGHYLLADSSSTGGVLSTHRVKLGPGADGAVPHRHDHASEVFYVLDGALDVLIGTDIVTAHTDDLLIVPPGAAHAFGAHHGAVADALILITPGIERFDYFRHVVQIQQGHATRESLLAEQDRYDTHFLDEPHWQAARS